MNVCEKYFKSILSENLIRNKNVIFTGDFNINVLDFEQNKQGVQGLQTFYFCVVNVIDDHAKPRFRRKLRG